LAYCFVFHRRATTSRLRQLLTAKKKKKKIGLDPDSLFARSEWGQETTIHMVRA